MKLPLIALTFVLAAAVPTLASNQPYSGQQHRTIKSMSAAEVEGHLKGYGLGYAKTAELNHYPGPAHLRELTKELGLSKDVTQQILAIEEQMLADAKKLGRHIVDLERKLDMMFVHAQPSPELVSKLTKEIGTLQGELRAIHLNAHLDVRPLLSKDIVERYDALRGYTSQDTSTPEQTHHHGH
ncbi:hypothetical protein V5T82_09785 [Magnetovibrio sp. PR-2]|uniref:hypothetical protein n=1 Tax=Magnetovibrio sp. PR-2 TaxID=3120356 RepID=UPI002FCE6270